MKQKRLLQWLVTAVSMLLLFSACSPTTELGTETTNPVVQTSSHIEHSTDEHSDHREDNGAVFRLGVMFNPSDTLDPATITSPGGMVLAFYVYDTLAMMGRDGLKLSLAESIEANEHGDTFTIRLRENARYSDGTDVTGQDIIDSFRYFSQSPTYQAMYGNIDFDASTSSGRVAVIKMKSPTADFAVSSLGMFSPVAPKGVFKGIGAGPYLVKEGDPGTGYHLVANEDYVGGAPAIKDVRLLPVMGSAAQANALLAGEIDYAWGLDAASIQSLQGAEDVVIPESSLDSAIAKVLVLNTRVAPFNDPEVRRAAKLTIDREKMVQTLLGESGEVANDMLGKGYAPYPSELPQTVADKAEAKRIFEEKGVNELTVVASDIVPGLVAATELMVQEFAEVGVNMTVREVDPQSFFSQMGELYGEQAFTFYWMNRTPLAEFRSQVLKDSPYNVSGYYSELTEREFQRAVSHSDETVQTEAIRLISRDIHENGGELIWGYQKQLSAHRKGVEGIFFSQSIPWIADATFVPES